MVSQTSLLLYNLGVVEKKSGVDDLSAESSRSNHGCTPTLWPGLGNAKRESSRTSVLNPSMLLTDTSELD